MMRRTIPFVVTVITALLAFPVLGIGQPFMSHGAPPRDVFMTQTTDVCNGSEPVGTEPVSLLPTPVSVGEKSHVLVYFTATLSHYREPELVLGLRIEGPDEASSGQWIERGDRGHSTVTVMWPFSDVAPGDYTVKATANMGGPLQGRPGANLQACTLTAFVMPAVA